MPTIAPYGAWPSPISAALITGTQVGLSSPWLDGDAAYWCESRPVEAGPDHSAAPVGRRHHRGADARTLQPAHAGARIWRSPIHGAGRDRRRRRVQGPAASIGWSRVPRRCALTPESDAQAALRRPRARPGAAPRAGGARGSSRRRRAGDHAGGRAARRLARTRAPCSPTGHDFFAYPRPSPDGRSLAWLTWDHPDMPWDATTLWVAELDEDGRARRGRWIAGGRAKASCSPNGRPTASSTSCRTAATSGASTAVEGRSLARSRCWRPSWPGRCGSSARAGTTSLDAGTALAIATQLGRPASGPARPRHGRLTPARAAVRRVCRPELRRRQGASCRRCRTTAPAASPARSASGAGT